MKIGRNDPCPCGSGQKYKKCCEAKDDAKRAEELAAENAARPEPAAAEDDAKTQRQSDAAMRRDGFDPPSKQAAPARRPSHVRKRTV